MRELFLLSQRGIECVQIQYSTIHVTKEGSVVQQAVVPMDTTFQFVSSCG